MVILPQRYYLTFRLFTSVFQLQFEMPQNLNSQQPNPQLWNYSQPISEIQIKLNRKQQQTRSHSSPSATGFNCKICLSDIENLQIQREGMISPCLCAGSVKYIHEQCLVQWLNTLIKRNLQNGRNTPDIFCEICKYSYEYQIKNKLAFCQKWEIQEKIKLNWGIFGLGVFFILFAIIGVIALGVVISQQSYHILQGSPTYILGFIAVAALILVLLVWAYRILQIFFLKEMHFVKGVRNRKQEQSHNASTN